MWLGPIRGGGRNFSPVKTDVLCEREVFPRTDTSNRTNATKRPKYFAVVCVEGLYPAYDTSICRASPAGLVRQGFPNLYGNTQVADARLVVTLAPI